MLIKQIIKHPNAKINVINKHPDAKLFDYGIEQLTGNITRVGSKGIITYTDISKYIKGAYKRWRIDDEFVKMMLKSITRYKLLENLDNVYGGMFVCIELVDD